MTTDEIIASATKEISKNHPKWLLIWETIIIEDGEEVALHGALGSQRFNGDTVASMKDRQAFLEMNAHRAAGNIIRMENECVRCHALNAHVILHGGRYCYACLEKGMEALSQ